MSHNKKPVTIELRGYSLAEQVDRRIRKIHEKMHDSYSARPGATFSEGEEILRLVAESRNLDIVLKTDGHGGQPRSVRVTIEVLSEPLVTVSAERDNMSKAGAVS